MAPLEMLGNKTWEGQLRAQAFSQHYRRLKVKMILKVDVNEKKIKSFKIKRQWD